MKKTVRIALLALVLALAVPCAALAAPGDANLARSEEIQEKYQDYVHYSCVCGDALYLCGNAHLFSYRVGDADLAAAEFSLPDAGEGLSRGIVQMFSDGEALYLLCATYAVSPEGDSSSLERLELLPVELDGEEVRFGEPREMAAEELTVSYDGSSSTYLAQIDSACFTGGKLMLRVYDDVGRQRIYAMDIESGEGGFIEDAPEDIACIAPYEDGQLLIESCDYDARVLEFWLYDVAGERMSAACAPIEMEEDSYQVYSELAYSAESGRLFYMSGGYVMAMRDFDPATAEPVAELSNMYGDQNGGLLLPGDYYVFASYDAVAVRATDPDALPETRLVVKGVGYNESAMNAYYSFGNAHPDVAVVLDQTGPNSGAIVEAMMYRDDSVDIYMLGVASEDYDALMSRGFMAELDDEAITSAVDAMYPAIREALTRDGEVVAVPVSVYGWCPALDYEGFEKIGIPREEVPTSWQELLALLPQLPDMLPEDGSVRIFAEYETQGSMRSQLAGAILENWRVQAVASGRELVYDDPELIALLESVMALDLEALGLPAGDDDENYGFSVSVGGSGGERSYVLFSLSTGCTIGNFYGDAEPTPLSAIPGEEGRVPLMLTVAFVNPFSKNVELAQAFLAELLGGLENQTAYNLSDALNEPVRSQRMLDYIAEAEGQLESLRAQLASAEPVDKPALEEQIAEMERSLEDMEKYSWEISEREIEWYRSHADLLTVTRFDYLNAADEDGELSDMAEQFLQGRIPPASFLKEIDRKVRMRMREGN